MSTVPSKPIENTEWQVSSISNVIVYIKDSGTDTNTARYLGMASSAISIELRTDQIVTIDQINGQTLKEPITVKANGSFILSRKARFRIDNLRINVLTATTNLKFIALTTGRRHD